MQGIIPILILFFAVPIVSAQGFGTLLDEVQQNPVFTNAQYSIYAKYVDGPVVMEHNPSARLSPASILKLYTSAAVLDTFGANYQFETKIYHSGERKGAKINGDIYIRGGGDASLGSKRIAGTPDMELLLAGWAKQLKDAGVEKINGNIYADNSIFSGVPVSWRTSYQNIGNYFAAPSDGLSIADNSYDIYFEPATEGATTALISHIVPDIKSLNISNFVKPVAGSKGENVYVSSTPGSNLVELYGTMGGGNGLLKVSAAMPNPALFVAQAFKDALIAQEIAVKGNAALATPYDGYYDKTLLIIQKSPPLADLVNYTNKRSFNLYADSFLRSISAANNNIGSLSDGVSEVKKYLQKLNIMAEDFDVFDGSGLARDSIVSCQTTVNLLETVLKLPYGDVFYNSLPIAGDGEDSGNMARRLTHSSAACNAHIKTGTLERVRAHAGYVKDAKGRQLIFCIITNNFNGSLRDVNTVHEGIINSLSDIGLNQKPKRRAVKEPPVQKIINIRGR